MYGTSALSNTTPTRYMAHVQTCTCTCMLNLCIHHMLTAGEALLTPIDEHVLNFITHNKHWKRGYLLSSKTNMVGCEIRGFSLKSRCLPFLSLFLIFCVKLPMLGFFTRNFIRDRGLRSDLPPPLL